LTLERRCVQTGFADLLADPCTQAHPNPAGL